MVVFVDVDLVVIGFVVGFVVVVIGLRVVALESVGSLTGMIVVTAAFKISTATSLSCKIFLSLL